MMLPARLLSQDGWTDVVIRDLSTGGLGAQSPRAPTSGSYVEIRRLNYRLVGRVTWSNGSRFGVVLRERIAVNSVATGQAAHRAPGAGLLNERRLATRAVETDGQRRINTEERARQNRQKGQIFVFVSFIFAIFIAAAVLYRTVEVTLSAPMETVSRHLAR